MTKNTNIGIVLLAAGDSSRLKQNKLMLRISGVSLLEKAIRAAVQSEAGTICVVAGAKQDETYRISLSFPVETVLNNNWRKGIGSSVKCGLKNMIEKHPGLQAVIISVCDQLFLSQDVFNGLISTFEKSGKKIVASAYSNSLGVPVLYDRSYFDELLSIPDGDGAKKHIIEKATKDIIATFPFPKGTLDIDTMEDLKQITSD